MKNSVVITLIIIFLGFTLVSALLFNTTQTFYYLTIPEENEIEDISLNQKMITNQEDLKTIYNNLTDNSKGRKARAESTGDEPTEAEGLVKVEINSKDGKKTTVYVYKQKYKYLIEQPHNGQYIITKEEYETIEELSK